MLIVGNSVRCMCFKKNWQWAGVWKPSQQEDMDNRCINFLNGFNVSMTILCTTMTAVQLIDKCSSHGNRDKIPGLSNVVVVSLPPNCTPQIQTVGAGIIAALISNGKSLLYRWRWCRANIQWTFWWLCSALRRHEMKSQHHWLGTAVIILGFSKKDKEDTTGSEAQESMGRFRQDDGVVSCLEATVNNLQSVNSTS